MYLKPAFTVCYICMYKITYLYICTYVLAHCMLLSCAVPVHTVLQFSPVYLSSGCIVDKHHLNKEAGGEARVIMTNTHTRQRANIMTLHDKQTSKHNIRTIHRCTECTCICPNLQWFQSDTLLLASPVCQSHHTLQPV